MKVGLADYISPNHHSITNAISQIPRDSKPTEDLPKTSTMKQYVALSLLSLATSVRGHGYLTIPNSRTRLGFEVRPLVKRLDSS